MEIGGVMAAAFAALILGGLFLSARAQTNPQVVISWRAETYAPASYTGKALPVADARVVVALDFIDQGKIADISSQTIYWYVDNNLISKGRGMANASFRVPKYSAGAVAVRVELPDYQNGPVTRGITIPVARPEIIIETPFFKNKVRPPSFSLSAIPYFFTVADASELFFAWKVNGEGVPGAGDPAQLAVQLNADAPAGSPVRVDLSVRNPATESEAAANTALFTIQ